MTRTKYETDAERRLRRIGNGLVWFLAFAFYMVAIGAIVLGAQAKDWPFVSCVLLALILARLYTKGKL